MQTIQCGLNEISLWIRNLNLEWRRSVEYNINTFLKK